MSLTHEELDVLCARLHLGNGHEEQEDAVRTALTSLLVSGKKGVVLADEVGFGKTYEALAIMSLLCEYARATRRSFDRSPDTLQISPFGKVAGGVERDSHGQGIPALSRP